MVIAVLTAGGDCPGLNAVIRAVTTRATASGSPVVGVLNGWEGLITDRMIPLDRDRVRGILARGGTILGTSRMDPYIHADGAKTIALTMQTHGIDSVIVIGGDGSLRTAARLCEDGIKAIGVPKTIDNDIAGTDMTIGFDTAVQIVTDAIDRLTTTAEAHNRIMVIEVMGRSAGWIAAAAGMAGGAEMILVPEVPYDLEQVANALRHRHEGGRTYSIVVVAEGLSPPPGSVVTEQTDAFGFFRPGGVSFPIAARLEQLTGFETRVTVLGHLQRGGTPTAFDRILATRFGVGAAEAALRGESGVMMALRGTEIVTVSLADACAIPRALPPSRLEEAAWFFAG